MRRVAAIGIVLVVAGAFLAAAFWPLASVSGSETLAARSGGTYTGYTVGARILVRERVTDVTFAQFLGSSFTWLHLEDGNADEDTFLYIRGDARSVVSAGMTIYATAVLQQTFGVQYWEVATPQDVRDSTPIDAAFFGILGAGVVILAVEAIRKR